MRAPEQKIYLASKSPRRRELLRQVGIDFEILMLRDQGPRGPDVDETPLPEEEAGPYVARVTADKARAARRAMLGRKLPPRLILAADTSVVIDGMILGKPADAAEAAGMLRRLSGRTHQVMTSIAVIDDDDRLLQQTQVSLVTFNTLTEQEIAAYCATAEPYDKAGGYGIQGLAALFISDIAGSYSGIMGLPIFETAQLLQKAGFSTL